MIPKITFVYSAVYDRRCRSAFEKGNPKELYPEEDEIMQYIKNAEKKWRTIEKRILKGISNSCKLLWKENIKCYVVGKIRPFSDPLSICIYDDINIFIDVLVHELIHQILTQNYLQKKKYLDVFTKRYAKESLVTRNHILVHAIHKKIYMKYFNEKRLLDDIGRCIDHDYKRSWDIVQEYGYEKILKEWRMVK
ncbi:MAG: hypothetical protein ACP5NV_01190 [Candidatus Woesearchaeota archaeon]